jgi:hypothetical protein
MMAQMYRGAIEAKSIPQGLKPRGFYAVLIAGDKSLAYLVCILAIMALFPFGE